MEADLGLYEARPNKVTAIKWTGSNRAEMSWFFGKTPGLTVPKIRADETIAFVARGIRHHLSVQNYLVVDDDGEVETMNAEKFGLRYRYLGPEPGHWMEDLPAG